MGEVLSPHGAGWTMLHSVKGTGCRGMLTPIAGVLSYSHHREVPVLRVWHLARTTRSQKFIPMVNGRHLFLIFILQHFLCQHSHKT